VRSWLVPLAQLPPGQQGRPMKQLALVQNNFQVVDSAATTVQGPLAVLNGGDGAVAAVRRFLRGHEHLNKTEHRQGALFASPRREARLLKRRASARRARHVTQAGGAG
jgi:hypothetical protein